MIVDDTGNSGGEEMSLEQAAAAYAKTLSNGAEQSQPEDDAEDKAPETDDELQASEEDVSEEDGGETDEEGQAEDEVEDEPGSDQGRYVAKNGKVRLEDGSTVTVDELIKGNLRDRDYRQKTMALAEERKAFDGQSAASKQLTEQVNAERQYMAALLRSIVPDQPDPTLAQTSPGEYIAAKARYDQFTAHLGYIEQQINAGKQQDTEKASTDRRSKIDQEWSALVEKDPNLKDETKAKALLEDALKYGTSPEYGFTDAELRQMLPTDHRLLLVLRKAIRWDKLQASKANATKKLEGRPPVQRGGKRLSSNERQARKATDAMSRLKETGSVDDAVRAYLASKG